VRYVAIKRGAQQHQRVLAAARGENAGIGALA